MPVRVRMVGLDEVDHEIPEPGGAEAVAPGRRPSAGRRHRHRRCPLPP
ncbi:hypothetical protein KCH_34140 [Kitasatospora cheerisanensis KCTC 2395]|uniref:Uncharacterized protein n=1 Tax=Kitasatospora cheerisanensis KCTC 2395 TaxID=1348663 RepID=A0A066YUG6_9ACTN|nr:hypothetical protein KCH_34140 [Kitasatospora cheerisanensis KCTC 2395]